MLLAFAHTRLATIKIANPCLGIIIKDFVFTNVYVESQCLKAVLKLFSAIFK